MILVLSGADFSENNLGQVEVTTTLDNFTLAAIEASGNASMTDVQKSTLNSFFRDLGAFGDKSNIWSKMNYVYLPMLASDLAHSMVNYKGNDASLSPNDIYFQLRNHGITGYDSTARTIPLTLSSGVSLRDMSAFFMDTETILSEKGYKIKLGDTSAARVFTGFKKNGANGKHFTLLYNTGSPKHDDAFCLPEDVAIKAKNLGGVSIYGTTIHYLNSAEVKEVTTVDVPNVTTGTNARLFSNLSDAGITSDSPATGLLMLGTHVSQEEMLIIKNASERLRNAMLV